MTVFTECFKVGLVPQDVQPLVIIKTVFEWTVLMMQMDTLDYPVMFLQTHLAQWVSLHIPISDFPVLSVLI